MAEIRRGHSAGLVPSLATNATTRAYLVTEPPRRQVVRVIGFHGDKCRSGGSSCKHHTQVVSKVGGLSGCTESGAAFVLRILGLVESLQTGSAFPAGFISCSLLALLVSWLLWPSQNPPRPPCEQPGSRIPWEKGLGSRSRCSPRKRRPACDRRQTSPQRLSQFLDGWLLCSSRGPSAPPSVSLP